MPALSTKGILTYGYCQVLIHALALNVMVTARAMGTPAVKCLNQQLALLGEVAVKVFSLAGITCDLETEMLILTMYLAVFEKVKYFRNVFKYK